MDQPRKNRREPIPRCRLCRKLLSGTNDVQRGVTRYGYQGDGVFCTSKCGVSFAREVLKHDVGVTLYQEYPIRRVVGTAPCGVCGQYPDVEGGTRRRCKECGRYGHGCCMRGTGRDFCVDCMEAMA